MLNINSKGKQLIAAALPAILASHFLLRANQKLFGLSSDFLGGLFLALGVALAIMGLSTAGRRHGEPR